MRVGPDVSVSTGAGVAIITGIFVGEDVTGAIEGGGVTGAFVETTGGDVLATGAFVDVGEATGGDGLELFVLLSVTQTLFISLSNQPPSVEMDTLGTVCFWDAVEPLGKVDVSLQVYLVPRTPNSSR